MIFSLNTKAVKCVVCKQTIIGEYIFDSWGNAAHRHHNNKPIEFCNSCFRIIEESKVFKSKILSDGRKLCFQCSLTKVESLSIAQQSFKDIKTIYHKFNLLNIPDLVRLRLVTLTEIKRVSKSNVNSIRGLTTTTYIVLGNQKKYNHNIYILTGLPRLEFEAVLGHEMLHVFLTENNILLPFHKMEGFCNLGSFLIYARDKSKHGHVMLTRMEKNPDYAYGVSYREMKSILLKSGWRELIQQLK
jgi:hypothetical protein